MGDWQGYIDGSLIGSGNMHSAAIVGKADGSYWAYGGSYVPQPDEVQHILAAIASPDVARASGIKIAGQKYFTLLAEPGKIFCKFGAGGAALVASNQTVVIGLYGEGINPAACNMTVEGVAKYLSDAQY
jgi:profilin